MRVETFRSIFAINKLIDLGKYDIAQAKIMELLSQYPDDSDVKFVLARVLLHKGELEESRRITEEIIAQVPDSSEAHNLLGVYYEEKGQLGKAENSFKQALSTSPQEAIYLANLAGIYLARKQYDKAMATAKMGLESDPEHESCQRVIYYVHRDKGNTIKAEAILKKLLANNPESTGPLIDLGYSQYNKDEFLKADKTFKSVISLGGDHSEALRGIKSVRVGDHPINEYLGSSKLERPLITLTLVLTVVYGAANFADYNLPLYMYEVFLIGMSQWFVNKTVPRSLSMTWIHATDKIQRPLFKKLEIWPAYFSTGFYLIFVSILVLLHIEWLSEVYVHREWVIISVYSMFLAFMLSIRSAFDDDPKVHYGWITFAIVLYIMADSFFKLPDHRWSSIIMIIFVMILDVKLLIYVRERP